MKQLIYILLFLPLIAQAQFFEIDGKHITHKTKYAELEITTTDGSAYKVDWGDGRITSTPSGERMRHGYTMINTDPITFPTDSKIEKITIYNGVEMNLSALSLANGLTGIYVNSHISNKITGNISYLAGVNHIRIDGNGNTVTGDISSLAGANYVRLYGWENTVTGDISSLAGTNYIFFSGDLNTVTGDISYLAGASYISFNGAAITVTGDISYLAGASNISFNGDAITVTGDISYLAGASNISFDGDLINVDYTTTTWNVVPENSLVIQTLENGISQTEVDNLLIDLSNATIIPTTGNKIIQITNNNAAPSGASASAISFLQSKGYTIITN